LIWGPWEADRWLIRGEHLVWTQADRKTWRYVLFDEEHTRCQKKKKYRAAFIDLDFNVKPDDLDKFIYSLNGMNKDDEDKK